MLRDKERGAQIVSGYTGAYQTRTLLRKLRRNTSIRKNYRIVRTEL